MLGRFTSFPTLSMLDASDRNAPTSEKAQPQEQTQEWLGLRSPVLFSIGRVVATPAAIVAIVEADGEPGQLLQRHRRGDWGDLCEEDRAANRKAVVLGYRLLSAYTLPDTGQKIWIITEADRSVTTLLLPSEY
jgi:hypothetical protein